MILFKNRRQPFSFAGGVLIEKGTGTIGRFHAILLLTPPCSARPRGNYTAMIVHFSFPS